MITLLKQILNIRKEKDNILIDKILNHIDKTSNTTQYKMVPINKKDLEQAIISHLQDFLLQ